MYFGLNLYGGSASALVSSCRCCSCVGVVAMVFASLSSFGVENNCSKETGYYVVRCVGLFFGDLRRVGLVDVTK
jgi:hypothetical protein